MPLLEQLQSVRDHRARESLCCMRDGGTAGHSVASFHPCLFSMLLILALTLMLELASENFGMPSQTCADLQIPWLTGTCVQKQDAESSTGKLAVTDSFQMIPGPLLTL